MRDPRPQPGICKAAFPASCGVSPSGNWKRAASSATLTLLTSNYREGKEKSLSYSPRPQ